MANQTEQRPTCCEQARHEGAKGSEILQEQIRILRGLDLTGEPNGTWIQRAQVLGQLVCQAVDLWERDH